MTVATHLIILPNDWIGTKGPKRMFWRVIHRLQNAMWQRQLNRKTSLCSCHLCGNDLKISIYFDFQAKKLIDYLLNETHFTEHDITSHPRVFSNSVETLENRIKELLSVELKPKRLYIICLDRKSYLKFIEKHCSRLNDKRIWSNFQKIETEIKQKCKWRKIAFISRRQFHFISFQLFFSL